MGKSWSLLSLAGPLFFTSVALLMASGSTGEETLSPEEKKAGWILLFDGKSLDGWQTSSGQPSKVPVEDRCLNPHGSGAYMLIHRQTWSDFVLNGENITRMDLDQWTVPNRRPDGSEHKFDIAYRDHPRFGYIGLQDHGSPCWYKNIKLLPLRVKGSR